MPAAVFRSLYFILIIGVQVLESFCRCSAAPFLQTAVLQAVRTALQQAGPANKAAAVASSQTRQSCWAQDCAARVLPWAAADVHARMQSGSADSLGADNMQVLSLCYSMPMIILRILRWVLPSTVHWWWFEIPARSLAHGLRYVKHVLIQVVAETLKLLVATLAVADGKRSAVMNTLLTLLIEVSKPLHEVQIA